MVGMNRALNNEIEMVFLMAEAQHQAIASKLVKEIARMGGDVSKFVSPEVAAALVDKFRPAPAGGDASAPAALARELTAPARSLLSRHARSAAPTTMPDDPEDPCSDRSSPRWRSSSPSTRRPRPWTSKYLTLELEDGPVKIELLPEVAPKHVERVVTLAEQGAYDGVAFHRVIEGFMAQTGDVEHGEVQPTARSPRAPAPAARTSATSRPSSGDVPFERGTVGMARSQSTRTRRTRSSSSCSRRRRISTATTRSSAASSKAWSMSTPSSAAAARAAPSASRTRSSRRPSRTSDGRTPATTGVAVKPLPFHGISQRSSSRIRISIAKPMAPMMMMPMTTTSVCKKFLAIIIIEPTPWSAATSSAATSVPQQTPIAVRSPVKISGKAFGRMTWRSTCAFDAPSE